MRALDDNTNSIRSPVLSPVDSVAFSPDGKWLASSGCYDYTVRLWNANTGERVRTLHGHSGSVNDIAFSSDRKTIASGSDDTTVRLWDAKTGTHLWTLLGHTDSVESLAFSPDGKTLASGSLDKTVLWDAKTGEHQRTLAGHTGSVESLAFSPDGKTLASGYGTSLGCCHWGVMMERCSCGISAISPPRTELSERRSG